MWCPLSAESLVLKRGSCLTFRPQWYRKLCVMVWILESMQLESPHHAVPLAKCWNLDCKYTDEVGRKRIYEHKQKMLPRWHDLHKRVMVSRQDQPWLPHH